MLHVGDLICTTNTNSKELGIVMEHKPNEPVGASWIPERYVVYWLGSEQRTTEFVGDTEKFLKVLSSAKDT